MPNTNLKPITAQGVPKAIEKAQHYRVLNEPWEAQSICRDVLAVDPANQPALVTLILSMTDQFDWTSAQPIAEVQALLSRLTSQYEREYYAGIIKERWAKAHWRQGEPLDAVSSGIREAMACFDRAERIAPINNDDAMLRWNTCVRILEQIDQTRQPPIDLASRLEADFGLDASEGPPLVES